MSTLQYYKLIRNTVQLSHATLVSMNCANMTHFTTGENEVSIPIVLQREVNVISEDKAEIFLKTIVGSEEGPFIFDILHKGICVSSVNIDRDEFNKYAYDQVVPLLLPYARECIASTMAKMGLPIYTLPTMDVLNSLEVNMSPEDN
ncbi:protein-export chaperone SecB [Metabacillus fastidiosus]|uniref:protein-export chaperone SecB n=1 Tax=Metabacillus fastidiosus TaxID=1458 RepID=UPI002E202B1A|nr:protein-export chaperone SecB [Metabacillus fastidiosus]MED4455880.1 protein-export chaperone SecB [Metabacillus fastidiosus]